MERGSLAAQAVASDPQGSAPGEKGLKTGAIGFVSSVVIGVASTAPGYSLAAVLGLIVAIKGVGVHAPAIMIASFIPILFVATAYRYLNRADPDCGTTFSWATRAFGPATGWIGGWAIIVADIIVMANLAQIAGLYTFLLFDVEASTAAVTVLGCVFIAAMTWICVVGIELNAKTQRWLLSAEVVTLAAFAIVALVRVYADAPPEAVKPALSWFSPFAIDSVDALVSGVLIGIFIYWGWDSLVTVNEETEDSDTVPGKAAVLATVILLGIYVIVSTAAVAFGGPDRLAAGSDSGDVLGLLANDVFGSDWLGKLVIIAVLTSAAASTQTTILPTARTSLSMARAKALPRALGEIHQRYLTPHVSTLWMGGLSVVWYVGLTIVSENILFDSIAALGLMIAFYYGLTGFACVWYFRREIRRSAKAFFLAGVMPLLGGLMLLGVFIKSCVDLSKPENSTGGDSWAGIGPPLVIGLGFLVVGVFLMILWRLNGHPEFFGRKREVSPPGMLDEA
jgi:amino acid transporter